MISTIVNLLASIYLIYSIYYKQTTKLNFILGNILLLIILIVLIIKIAVYMQNKKAYNENKDLIEEILKENKK